MPGIIHSETWNHSGAAQFVGNRSPWSANRSDFLGNGFGAFVWDNSPNPDFVYANYPGDSNKYCYTIDATSTDHYYTFSPRGEGAAFHAIVRYADADNFIGIQLQFGRVYYRIRSGGVDGALTEWVLTPFDTAALYEVRAEGTTLKLFKNTVQLGATLTISTASPTATRAGFGTYTAGANPFLGPVELGFLGVAQSGTIAISNIALFSQMAPGITTKSVSIAISWTGAPTSIRRRLENADGSVVAGFDWAVAVATPTGTSANFTIPNVPAGGPYFVRVDFSNAASVTARQSNGFHVGLIILALGQSNTVGLGQTGTPAAPEAKTFLWQSGAGIFGPPQGDGHIALLNRASTALTIPVAIINVAVGATALAAWQPGQPNYQNALAQITLAGGDVGAIIWGQGEADAANVLVSGVAYAAGLTSIYTGLRTAMARTSAQLPFFIAVTGRNARALGQAYGDDASWQAVRAAQMSLVQATSGVFIGAHCIDLPMGDSIHYTNAGYAELGKRLGRSVAKTINPTSLGYDGAGPQIISANRNGAVITLTCDLRGSAALSGTPPLTGWEISSTNFATLLVVQSTAIQGQDKIIITLAAAPAANESVQARYLHGADPSITALVTGAVA
jgi:Carbohydrate esterase, sialic acid-specific acetylesterase